MPWTSNYIQVYDIIFPNSWSVPIHVALNIHDLRPGSAEVGGGMKVGLGQDETFVDVVVVKDL